jgi:hypothetical protein
MGIGRTGGEKHRIGMPREGENGRSERFLQMLGDPPVVLLLKIAHSDDTSSRSNGKLALIGRPADVGCCTIDTEENEGRFPAGWRRLPDQSIAIYNIN